MQLHDCVITDRGGIVENRHQVHAAVVDASGKLLFSVGDPHRITLARSAAKPAQALAILETGAFAKFAFDEADLALMCASHSSEERHLQRTYSMLAKVGVKEDDLRCGGHAALSEGVNRAWIKNDFVPGGACNNCSGKHCGMIAGAKALDACVEDYHLPGHPMQVKVKQVVSDLVVRGADTNEVLWGVDGCNLPAPAFPLRSLATLYASFADAADKAWDVSTERERNMARTSSAMARYPEMIGGENRYCTQLIEAFEGILIGKLGADGCYGIAVRASEQTRHLGSSGALGIGVKIEDGSIEILYYVVTEIVEQLEIGTPAVRARLRHYHHLERRNTMNVVTGKVTLAFKIRPDAQV
ncbi:l-asparaginase ii [Seiridium cupressi]